MESTEMEQYKKFLFAEYEQKNLELEEIRNAIADLAGKNEIAIRHLLRASSGIIDDIVDAKNTLCLEFNMDTQTFIKELRNYRMAHDNVGNTSGKCKF